MRIQRIIIALAAVGLFCGGVYLLISVSDNPKPKKRHAAATRALSTTPRTLESPSNEVPPKNKSFVRRSTSPDLLPDGSERPKPFQARSEPARNDAWFVGVESEEMAHRVVAVQRAYFDHEWQKVVDDGIALAGELPENVQVRRFIVRAACNAGNTKVAKEYLVQLSASDQEYMLRHCRIYGIPLD